ncbi:conserved hypothetical protein [uncultured Desulfobacterium sp.]|uniref:Uncharacterized protein n=1 Tax=uncultured Desulfobacterium sp. TaxID=201089 RepID=A0A445N0W8_9BACT|nr:conserved hypothetical protein [uncultured Desulfobacterium sp.]
MEILVCIDDTDNLESRGTGKLAAILCDHLENNHWGVCRPITRHQMLVHPDIPYTSHNSAMCFVAEIGPQFLSPFTDFAQSFLVRESAPGSDPGLCIVRIDHLDDPDSLIEFGRITKTSVVTKDDAYKLAAHLKVHLSEHGGTGQGVIGAIAGCGLRLSGNDGRFRGHFKIDADCLRVDEFIRQTGCNVVMSLNGYVLRDDETVRIGEKVKSVLKENKAIQLVYAQPDEQTGETFWRTCTKEQLRVF